MRLVNKMAMCILMSTVVGPAAFGRHLSPQKISDIQKIVAGTMAANRVPAMSVAVGMNGKIIWKAAFGRSDIETHVQASNRTEYRVGSVTKVVTAVAIMQLVEHNLVNLDAPVQKYVPSFPQKPYPITIRQLLGHLSGIRNYKNASEENSGVHMSSLEQAINQFKDDPLLFQPGTRFAYSSHAFTLLGAVIESVSGVPYMEYIDQHISKPEGLPSLKLDSGSHPIRLLAKGYIEDKGELIPAPLIDLSNRIPAGGLDGDAEDLVRFAMAAQDGILLNKNTFAQMITPQKYVDGKQVIVWKDDSVGLGWFLGLEPLEHSDPGAHWDVASHPGSEPGFSAELYAVPQKNLAIALLANKDSVHTPLAVLADNIRHIVLNDGSLPVATMIAASKQHLVESTESSKFKKTANAQTASALIGDWQGSIDTGNNGFIRVVLHFKVSGNEVSGTLDSPDQGATSIAIGAISFERSIVRFDIPAISGQFEGELRDSQISGRLNQAGASLPVTLTRMNAQPVPQK